MEIISSTKPIARKKHKCDFCNQTIVIGEKYQSDVNKHEGELYIWKSHLSCIDLLNELDMQDCGEGITSEEFVEYVNDAFFWFNSGLKEKAPFKQRLNFFKNKYLNNKES